MKTTVRVWGLAVNLVYLSACGLLGCAHGGTTEQQAAQAKEEVSSSFEQAYQDVKSGARSTVRYGGYVLDRTGDGAVRVVRETKEGIERAGEAVSDAYLTAKVKGRLATDSDVESGRVSVDTDAGVVTLRGVVRDEHEASRAVQDAVTTSGVYAVNSELSWPSMRMGAQPPTERPM